MDFENFQIDKERAKTIRGRIQRLRESETVMALGVLVDEFGRDESEAPADGLLPGLSGKEADKSRVFETGQELLGETRLLRIERSGQELRLLVDGKKLLDLSFLPKNVDYLVNNMAPESEDDLLEAVLNALMENARLAKGKKFERQAAFRAKFQKKEAAIAAPVEEIRIETAEEVVQTADSSVETTEDTVQTADSSIETTNEAAETLSSEEIPLEAAPEASN